MVGAPSGRPGVQAVPSATPTANLAATASTPKHRAEALTGHRGITGTPPSSAASVSTPTTSPVVTRPDPGGAVTKLRLTSAPSRASLAQATFCGGRIDLSITFFRTTEGGASITTSRDLAGREAVGEPLRTVSRHAREARAFGVMRSPPPIAFRGTEARL